jgi:putative methyltransferase (TIGR04325 family)
MSARALLRSIVPPLLWSIGSRIKRRVVRSTTLLEYAPEGWSTPLPRSTSSDDSWIASLAQERVACEKLIVRVRAHEPLLHADLDENSKYCVFGYVLALASRHQTSISVLDYGGNLGDYYWIGKALVAGVELEFHCKELPAIAAAGRELTPEVVWHTDDTCLEASYDLVMFSSSLQYLPEWKAILQQAAQSTRHSLLLSDVPSVRHVPPFVITQRSRGRTSLQYLLNRSEIIDTVQRAGLRLEREFAMGPHPPVANAPEQPTSVGWLFRR